MQPLINVSIFSPYKSYSSTMALLLLSLLFFVVSIKSLVAFLLKKYSLTNLKVFSLPSISLRKIKSVPSVAAAEIASSPSASFNAAISSSAFFKICLAAFCAASITSCLLIFPPMESIDFFITESASFTSISIFALAESYTATLDFFEVSGIGFSI